MSKSEQHAIKTDCFAYNGAKAKLCEATTRRHCDKCRFYKTRQQFETDRARAKELNSLAKEKTPLQFGESRSVLGKIQIGTYKPTEK
ncbi:MAG: hypothetical protein ACI4IS_00335 [Acutalibacteraceae bacterium]